MPVHYDGITVDVGFRADIIVENHVILELKSVEKIHDVHIKQLLTYKKKSDMHLGLLINFGAATIKEGITRIINCLPE